MLDEILKSITNGSILEEEKKKIDFINNKDLKLIDYTNYVGEVIDINYNLAIIQVSDFTKERVNGIPQLSFLVASRQSEHAESADEEDEIILLRVIDFAELPGDMDRKKIRAESAEQMSAGSSHWEYSLDPQSRRLMSFSGLKCRILGTFYLPNDNSSKISFGSDISNFYLNRGLKVYKPSGDLLNFIVNFGINEKNSINIGSVRYSSTRKTNDSISSVKVKIDPSDLVSQKTAIFGMTRTGKSNTVKTIVKSLYQLRFSYETHHKVGQIIFDPNGEYANDNLQDSDIVTGQAQSIKNLWKIPVHGLVGNKEDIEIYSLGESYKDPTRKIMKINFYDDNMIEVGKDLINNKIEQDGSGINSLYMKNFINLYLSNLVNNEDENNMRQQRRLLVYKTLLSKSNFEPPNNGYVSKSNLFSNELLASLEIGVNNYEIMDEKEQIKYRDKKNKYLECYEILNEYKTQGSSYYKLQKAFKILHEYMNDSDSSYHDFNRKYSQKNSNGESWSDTDLDILLTMFSHNNSTRIISKANVFHNHNLTGGDYADQIYKDLSEGKLVIIDQALGDSRINKIAARRILHKIFTENSKKFSNGENPPEIIIFAEEAHNLMPKGSDEDYTNIWARVAKEGAKFKIGMVYSTQEVSSIQRNILKNTTNWFISHLNNREEVSALETYYDFADFSKSILSCEDKGFIRMKTRSNKFIVPIQIDIFQVR